MCYINSASLEPCDCYGECDECNEQLDGDSCNDVGRFTVCNDCFDKGTECNNCDNNVAWGTENCGCDADDGDE